MVIAKTASRNVLYKANNNKLGESTLARQSEMLMPEEELGSQSPVSYEEDFEDLIRAISKFNVSISTYQ